MSGNGREYLEFTINSIKDEIMLLQAPKSILTKPIEISGETRCLIELELYKAENGDYESLQTLQTIINNLKTSRCIG